jgi:PAS domain S-box-containing protein
LLEAITDILLELDAQRRILGCSPSSLGTLGYQPAELLGRDALELVPEPDRSAVAEALGRVLAQPERVASVEHRLRHKDGRLRLFETRGRAVGGGRVVAISRDLTDRKRAAEEQARLALAVEQGAESIVITDPTGAILYVNPAFEQLTGYTRDEVLGRNPRILKSGHQDAAFYEELWATLTRGEVWHGTFVNRRKDGTPFEEAATISPVRDAQGRTVNYVAVKRDVTREHQLEDQFRRSQRLEAIGKLAGGVAHDFNNLLGVISGYGDIVLRRLPQGDPLRGKMAEILKAADRAAALTHQLLAFSRRQVLKPRVLDLNAVVADMERMLRRTIGEDVTLRTVLAPELGRVTADPGQLEQVVMNLAVNAREAMPGGGRLTIETRDAELSEAQVREGTLVPPGRYVLLAVTDTGTGIDDETRAHLFEPFYTTKPGGTGLGLSTVYGIVKQSGGYIWVYSEAGQGTTFKLYLPRADAALATAPPVPEPAPAGGAETLLLIEDEEPLRAMLAELLESQGYLVLQAANGEEALARADAYPGPISLLITDVVLPRLSGRATAEELARSRPELKVLFMSGYTDDAIVRHGILQPGVSFLNKPFASQALLRKLRELLD